jgi:hypothetical protein
MSGTTRKLGRNAAIATLLLGCLPCVRIDPLVPEARAQGPRLTVHVSEPFEFQGRLWPASTLSVLPGATYNPVATLDEVWIGTECLGRMVADRMPSAVEASDDVMLFARNAADRLVLIGYALRGAASAYHYRSYPAQPDDGAGGAR